MSPFSATGDVSAIAQWQITLQGDPNRELISISPTGFNQMDFTQLSYQGLAAPVAGVTVDNTGSPISTTDFLIVHGDKTGFTSGAPNTLSFVITLLASPTWADLPGTYSGGLILTISAATTSAP